MSRAFVKEDDERATGAELPERQQSHHPNYVTPRGLADLEQRFDALSAERSGLVQQGETLGATEGRRRIERELRYLKGQIERAILVDPAGQPRDEVAFGATVRVGEADGGERAFCIVGEDEADVASGRVSWVSPLARALLGARVGDSVTWRRPSGAVELEILAVDYD